MTSQTNVDGASMQSIVIQPLEFLSSRRNIAGVSSVTVWQLLENAERLEHALQNIQIQVDEGSKAREIESASETARSNVSATLQAAIVLCAADQERFKLTRVSRIYKQATRLKSNSSGS